MTESGEPMLTDFGIAKILEDDGMTQLTGTGIGIGTPDYMAPEQWTGEVVPQTDIYSLGVVLYELVTSVRPFTADTPAAVLVKLTSDPLPRPKIYVPDLPDTMEHVIIKALAKDPADRYETMRAFAEALESLIAQKTVETSQPDNDETRMQETKTKVDSMGLPEVDQDVNAPPIRLDDSVSAMNLEQDIGAGDAQADNATQTKSQPSTFKNGMIGAVIGLCISLLFILAALLFELQGYGLLCSPFVIMIGILGGVLGAKRAHRNLLMDHTKENDDLPPGMITPPESSSDQLPESKYDSQPVKISIWRHIIIGGIIGAGTSCTYIIPITLSGDTGNIFLGIILAVIPVSIGIFAGILGARKASKA
jgi:serine/threonine protein kinase